MDAIGLTNAAALNGGRHEFEEHTSELQIRLEAPSLPELFLEAGRALAEVMRASDGTAPSSNPIAPSSNPITPSSNPITPSSVEGPNDMGPFQSVHVRAADLSALLVEWLNELIFRAETERRIFTDFRIDRLTDKELTASIRGPEVELSQTAVKAATMHRVEIRKEPGRFFATVVLDV